MRTYFALLICLINILPLAAETVTESITSEGRLGHPIPQRPPGFIELRSGPPVTLPPLTASSADPERLMAGHLLRRIGFGPNKTEMDAVLKMGIRPYIEMQLVPSSIDDSNALSKLPTNPKNFYADSIHMERWYTRMVYTKRLLQEKMTLILHEHFSVSNFKVGSGEFMNVHEDLLRKYAFGNFRDLLIEITKDQAMLVFLDNNLNNGNAMVNGKRVPPNENYAREFLQLFALGAVRLNMDGTPVMGPNKQPRQNYTEKDVKEVARAFTGWYIQPRLDSRAIFWDSIHDSGKKTVLGSTIPGRSGADGAREVDDVIDIVMKHPSMPPFISKILIQKLATETPTPQYIQRVAMVFKQSQGDLKSVVRAILIDPEFYSPAVVRTQFKEPIEHFVGALRALKAKNQRQGTNLLDEGCATARLLSPQRF